jgi:hypothetical protein
MLLHLILFRLGRRALIAGAPARGAATPALSPGTAPPVIGPTPVGLRVCLPRAQRAGG